jgi:hypothetical protein
LSARLRIAGLAFLLLAAGCGEPPTVPLAVVHGKVTFRGNSLPGGVVVFTPDDDYSSHGMCATGRIGSDGRFALSMDGAAGVAAGKYRVTIAGPDGWPLPDKFLDPHLSGLRAEVLAGQENILDFKLEER